MENKRIMKWFSMLLLMMVASISGATAQSLSLESFDIKAGGTDEVAIQLVAENPIYGIQTDIVLSEGLSLDEVTAAVQGLEITSNQVNNATRVSLLSMRGAEIPAGGVINLKVTAAADFQRGTITLTNTRLTIDNKGNEQRADDVTAYVTLEQEMNTYTATFTTNAGWNEVYAYAWTTKDGATTEFLGGWPGTKLSSIDGVHVVTITATEAPAFIIFNNGGRGEGNQTEDLAFENGGRYSYTAPQPTKYTITVAADIVNGTVTADKVEAEAGEKVSLTVTPAENYELERLTVVDAGGNIVQVAEDYTFTMPAFNVMISASFKEAGQPVEPTTFTATFTTNAGWTDVYAYAWTTKDGATTEFLGGWPGTKLSSIDGVHVVTITATEAPAFIIFNNGAGEQTEDLAFENGGRYSYTAPQPTKYTITVAADIANGTVTADKVEAEAGETVSLTITPAENYELERLTVVDAGGNIVQVAEDNTFQMPAANVRVSASFKEAEQPVEPTTFTATFTTNAGWTDVYAYAWTTKEGATTEFLGEWPGTKLEAFDGVHALTFTATEAPAFIIFNNGGRGEGNQTEDLAFENGGRYSYTAPQPTKYTITVAADIVNGTVTADKVEAEAGEKVSLTVTPAEGYELERLNVVDAGGNIVQVAEDNTFVMPAANVTIIASFKKEAAKIEGLAIVGDFTGGWPMKDEQTGEEDWSMAKAMTHIESQPEIWTLEIKGFEAEAKTYEYKAAANNNWNDYVLPNGDNAKFQFGTDEYPAGKYDLFFKADTQRHQLNLFVTKSEEPQPEDVYIVAGNKTSIFGGEEAWAISEANEMELIEGKYLKTYTVQDAMEGVELKVVKNGETWIGDKDGENVKFDLTGAGEFTVVLDLGGENNGIVWVEGDIVKKSEPVQNTYTATFKTNAGWNEVYAYAWTTKDGATTEFLGGWPGTKLSSFDGIYALTFTAAEAPEKIIFNNGAGEQTDDLPFENGKAYEYTAPQPTKYTITVAEGIANGTVTTDKTEAEAGETVSLTVTPAEGYELEKLEVVDAGGNVVDIEKDNTFIMPAANVMIIASFKEAGQPSDDTWTVAGEPESLFGAYWDPSVTANDMVQGQDGLYRWEKTDQTLMAGEIKFKVVKNHAWGEEYPMSNYILTIAEDGKYTVTISFDPESKAIEATATKTGEVVIPDADITSVVLSGSWNNWATTPGEEGEPTLPILTKAEGSNVWTGVLDLTTTTADQFFKLVVNENHWLGVDELVLVDEGNLVSIENGTGNNFILKNEINGYQTYDITLSWEANSNPMNGWTLTITGKDKRIAEPAFADGAYYIMNTLEGLFVPGQGRNSMLTPDGNPFVFTFDANVGAYSITGSDFFAFGDKKWFVEGDANAFYFYYIIDNVKKYLAISSRGGLTLQDNTPATDGTASWILLTQSSVEDKYMSYTVAGTTNLTGTEKDYDVVAANKMARNTETMLFEKKFEGIAVTEDITPAFKVVASLEGMGDVWYPENAGNWVINTGVTGSEGIFTVTIAFNPATKEIAVTTEKTGSILVIKSMDIVGDLTGGWPVENKEEGTWDWSMAKAMTQSTENPDVWTLKVEGFQAEGRTYKYKAAANGSWDGGLNLPAEGDNSWTCGEGDYPAGKYDLLFTVNTKENTLTLLPVLREVEKVILEEEKIVAESEKLEIEEPFTSGDITVENGQIITIDAHEAESAARQRGARAPLDPADITIMYKPEVESAWTTADVELETTETGYQFEVKGAMAEAINARGFAIEAKKPIVVTEVAVVTEVPEPVYYAVGVTALWGVDAWTIDESNKLTLNDQGKYTITKQNLTLDENTNYGYKIVKVVGDAQTWVPDGMGDEKNLTVAEDAIYDVTLTLNPVEPLTIESYLAVATKTGDVEVTYTVFGAFYDGDPEEGEASIFGTKWDATNTANDMTLVDGLYTKTYENVELTPGGLSVKVAKNHKGENSYPADAVSTQIETAGLYDVVVTFNADLKEVTITATPKFTPTDDTYTVAGAFYDGDPEDGEASIFGTKWDATNTANDMEKQDDGTYKKEYFYGELTAGNIEFKVVKNHSWDVNYGWTGSGHGTNNAYYEILSALTDVTVIITFNPNGDTDYDKVQINVTGTATGINSMKAATLKDAQIYNLNGQRVGNAQKGLYIVNGKKVVLK